ncbi:MAG: hypothetical protein ACW98Y_10120, partial [Candidatus Thorarchaeota archaeon]
MVGIICGINRTIEDAFPLHQLLRLLDHRGIFQRVNDVYLNDYSNIPDTIYSRASFGLRTEQREESIVKKDGAFYIFDSL